MNKILLKLGLDIPLAAVSTAAAASCGSAFCTLMTDCYAQGTGQVTVEDAIERHTKNLNFITTLGCGFDEQWPMSVSRRLATCRYWCAGRPEDGHCLVLWAEAAHRVHPCAQRRRQPRRTCRAAGHRHDGPRRQYRRPCCGGLERCADRAGQPWGALNKRDEFRTGARIEASVGLSHAYSEDLGTVLQLNM
ncbi:hypothetical protein [Piscinibacter terrae]|uniref:hypothetical protein n=1 Tax=Piscinibacter terrae TaxID=2496871 RepID=UPI000F5A6B6D|nr:hypothetical protein [Albitalea terrae]